MYLLYILVEWMKKWNIQFYVNSDSKSYHISANKCVLGAKVKGQLKNKKKIMGKDAKGQFGFSLGWYKLNI